MNNLTKRTLSREYAFKFLYRLQLPEFEDVKEELRDSKNLKEALLPLINEFNTSYTEEDVEHPNNQTDPYQMQFSLELILNTLKNESVLKDKIENQLSNKNLHRLEKVNLTVLLIGSAELFFIKDTPNPVIINEYVNIAKKYGTPDAGALINSILDKLAKSE